MKEKIRYLFSGEILSSDVIKRQYKLVMLISGLIFMYIYNGYRSQLQLIKIEDLKSELRDAQIYHIMLSEELMDKTRQSAVAKMLQEQGSKIKERSVPAIRIQ